MYRGRLWTMRQYAGFATADETNQRFRYLLEQGQTGPLGRLRPADPDGLRLRRARGRGRGRPGRRADRHARRHGAPARRPPAGRGQHLDDDQRDGADPARALRGGGRERRASPATGSAGTTQNDILKEYIARGTYIYPPPAVDAPRDRHLRVLRRRAAALEHDLDLRLPHARGRGDGRPGAGVHARRRHRLRARRPSRAASTSTTSRRRLCFFFAAWSELFEEVAKFRAARRMWAADHARSLRRHERRAR